jgi:hypothetical protein
MRMNKVVMLEVSKDESWGELYIVVVTEYSDFFLSFFAKRGKEGFYMMSFCLNPCAP